MGRNKTAVQPPPTVRVEITASSHAIVLEGPGELDTVTARALALWRDVRTDSGEDSAAAFTVGFAAVSEPVHSPLMGPEAELPHRLQTTEEGDT